MKKLTRKLFISVMTLVLTAMALGTSTFAWFSMNTTVNATNMTVTAKSNATYLLIGTGNDDTADEIQTAASVTVTAGQVRAKSTEDFLRYPVAFNNTGADLAVNDANAQGGSTSVPNHAWYTASNKNSNNATNQMVNVQILDFENATTGLATEQNYVVVYKLYLTLSADSEAYNSSKYIKVSLTSPASNDLIGTLVQFGTGNSAQYVDLDKTNNQAFVTGYELNSTSVLEVTVYMYIDGNSTDVNSDEFNDANNASKFTGTVGLQFDLTFDSHQ